jgi:2',3'-cyclic-nucleotide 2'-phosphodiesterase (5'-nucleotidase family)
MIKLLWVVFIVASLFACSSHIRIHELSKKSKVDASISSSLKIDELIQPYKDSLDKEMNQVIGFSKDNFEIQRPSSSLMNWCADAIFANQTRNIKLAQPIFCLLNTGGLRSTIGKGTVSIGDIYKLMPFDNTIVWVELPISSIAEIEKYLSQSGGEPIANAKLENGKLLINGNNEKMTHFWVLTSDYLMNGGDKMSFFEQRTNAIMNGKLLRNAFIEEVKSQDTLIFNEELRIK